MVCDFRVADYRDKRDAEALATLLRAYTADPMGGGQALSTEHCAQVARRLDAFGHAFSVLAFDQGTPLAMANCLLSFSTFSLKPVVNIHDFFVAPESRGAGLGKRLLAAVEAEGRARGCCKITLEVLSNNTPAKNLYAGFGFHAYELSGEAGQALFWQKVIHA